MSIVYKVVECYNGDFCSCFAQYEFSLRYRIGEVTIAQLGELFAFKSLRSAREFRSEHTKGYILRCKTIHAHKPTFDFIPYEYYPTEMTGFWRAQNKKDFERAVMPVPEGTVLCQSLTPIAVCKN